MSHSELSYLMSEAAEGRLSRRSFLRQAALLGVSMPTAGALLSACGSDDEGASSSNGDGGGVLTVGHYGWVESSSPWLHDLATRFEEENGVRVELKPVTGSVDDVAAVVQKYSLEARQGKASYDVILGPTPWVEVGALAKAGALYDITELIPDSYGDRVTEEIRKAGTAPDGNVYAIPFWTDVIGYMHNTELVGSQPVPTDWDAVVAAATSLEPELPNDTFAYGADWAFPHRLFLPILVSLTDTPFAGNGTYNMADPAALRALEIINELVPLMPQNSSQNQGALEVFKSGRLAMSTYWQAKPGEAIHAGLDADQVVFSPNPGDSTIMWNPSAVVLKASERAELAVKFVIEGLLSDWAVEQTITVTGRIPALAQLPDGVDTPPVLQKAFDYTQSGISIPMNDAFHDVELSAFREQLDLMILEGQSPADTQAALVEAYSAYDAQA